MCTVRRQNIEEILNSTVSNGKIAVCLTFLINTFRKVQFGLRKNCQVMRQNS
jgi:hypothetical protein